MGCIKYHVLVNGDGMDSCMAISNQNHKCWHIKFFFFLIEPEGFVLDVFVLAVMCNNMEEFFEFSFPKHRM